MLELATLSDGDSLNRLAGQLCHQYSVWRPDLYEQPQVLYSQERIARERKARQLYMAKIGGNAIGYVRLRMEPVEGVGILPKKRMFIDEFCVEEAFRGQGFGTKMMQEVRSLARAFRCDDLQLKVYPQNDEAVAFWQKCGFAIRRIEMQQQV